MKRLTLFWPLCGLLFGLLTSGCAQITYQASRDHFHLGRPQILGNEEYQLFTAELDVEFYLWGLLPQTQTLDLATQLPPSASSRLIKITLQERQTLLDWGAMILSLGLYTPRTVTVTAYGDRASGTLTRFGVESPEELATTSGAQATISLKNCPTYDLELSRPTLFSPHSEEILTLTKTGSHLELCQLLKEQFPYRDPKAKQIGYHALLSTKSSAMDVLRGFIPFAATRTLELKLKPTTP